MEAFGSVPLHKTYKQAIEQSSIDNSKWSAIKKSVKTLITDNRRAFWRDYMSCLLERLYQTTRSARELFENH